MMSKLALLLVLAGASLAAAQNKMGIWSPLYYKLNPARDDEYAKFIESVTQNKCLESSFQGAILVGPTSRPPPLKNEDSPGQEARAEEYQRRFDYLYDAGDWQPFGYIYTNYALRPMDAVMEDIGRWCDPVNGYRASVRGIFIDQVTSSLACTEDKHKGNTCPGEYYQQVVDAVRQKCTTPEAGEPMIMLNPGRAFDECDFMVKNKIGFVNAFEDTYKTYKKFSEEKDIKCACKDKGVRCIASIHSVPDNIDVAEATAVMNNMAENGFSAIFLTENKYPHHYEKVPTIWPVVSKAACAIDLPKRRRAQRRMLAA